MVQHLNPLVTIPGMQRLHIIADEELPTLLCKMLAQLYSVVQFKGRQCIILNRQMVMWTDQLGVAASRTGEHAFGASERNTLATGTLSVRILRRIGLHSS